MRLVVGAISRLKATVRYLGFDSTNADTASQAEINLAVHEVGKATGISPHSLLVRSRIEDIGDERSLSLRRAKEFAPFDVVNLDFCNSIFAKDRCGAYHKLLKRLLGLQSATRVQPWLLFITTRIDRPDELDAITKGYLGTLLTNCERSADFRQQLEDLHGISVEDVKHELGEVAKLADVPFGSALVAGFSKWLTKLAAGSSPVTHVLPLQHYWYRVNGVHPDMISLGYKICPQPKLGKDVAELVKVSDEIDELDSDTLESELGIKHLLGLRAVVDADEVLKNDKVLLAKTIEQCRKLLVEAHYDGDAYLKWVDEGN